MLLILFRRHTTWRIYKLAKFHLGSLQSVPTTLWNEAIFHYVISYVISWCYFIVLHLILHWPLFILQRRQLPHVRMGLTSNNVHEMYYWLRRVDENSSKVVMNSGSANDLVLFCARTCADTVATKFEDRVYPVNLRQMIKSSRTLYSYLSIFGALYLKTLNR